MQHTCKQLVWFVVSLLPLSRHDMYREYREQLQQQYYLDHLQNLQTSTLLLYISTTSILVYHPAYMHTYMPCDEGLRQTVACLNLLEYIRSCGSYTRCTSVRSTWHIAPGWKAGKLIITFTCMHALVRNVLWVSLSQSLPLRFGSIIIILYWYLVVHSVRTGFSSFRTRYFVWCPNLQQKEEKTVPGIYNTEHAAPTKSKSHRPL